MTDSNPPSDLDSFLGVPPESPWRRRAPWIAGGIVLLLFLVLLVRCFGGSGDAGYVTEEVRRGDLDVTVSATGNLAPTNQVEVGSEVSGTIDKVLVDFNDKVHKGQPLAIIDTDLLDDQIAQSRANLAARQASVADARAALAVAQASLDRLREVEKLSGGKVPSRTEMEQAVGTRDRAVAAVRSAEANSVAARAELSSNMTRRSKAVIVAPVTGVVLSRQIEPGQTVAASFNTPTLFIIAEDLHAMQLEVAIDEADVGQVKAGQKARFTVDAWPGETFPARIERVNVGSNSLASKTGTSTSSSSASGSSTVIAYDAILSVENPDGRLRPGMTATADIAVRSVHDALLVPNSAFRFSPATAGRKSQDNGGLMTGMTSRPRIRGQGVAQERKIGAGSHQTIYVLGDDGKPKPVDVVTGASDGRRTAVSSGDLTPGMQVITGQRAEAE
mgnify:CR=1 FL=1